MKFKEQITSLELIVDIRPRIYIKWVNTEDYRDKTDCYERIEIGSTIIYVNTNNRNSSINYGHPFFETLEELYNSVLTKNKTN